MCVHSFKENHSGIILNLSCRHIFLLIAL